MDISVMSVRRGWNVGIEHQSQQLVILFEPYSFWAGLGLGLFAGLNFGVFFSALYLRISWRNAQK